MVGRIAAKPVRHVVVRGQVRSRVASRRGAGRPGTRSRPAGHTLAAGRRKHPAGPTWDEAGRSVPGGLDLLAVRFDHLLGDVPGHVLVMVQGRAERSAALC